MNNTALQVYDPSQVAIIFGGVIVTGFGDGSFITVERNADTWMLRVGTDGVATRSKSNNKSGRITIVVNQGAAVCDRLSALQVADEQANSGVVPFMLRDATGTTLCSAAQAWLVKPPSVEFAREAGDRTYVFETNNLDVFAGGNTAA